MTTILFRRRGLLAAIALGSAQWRVNAQERVRRVGVLNGVIQHDEGEALVALFRETLANLGWRAGRNLELEVRWSTASAESTRRAAGELLRWKPDVILARNTISVEKLLELKAELRLSSCRSSTRSVRANAGAISPSSPHPDEAPVRDSSERAA